MSFPALLRQHYGHVSDGKMVVSSLLGSVVSGGASWLSKGDVMMIGGWIVGLLIASPGIYGMLCKIRKYGWLKGPDEKGN